MTTVSVLLDLGLIGSAGLGYQVVQGDPATSTLFLALPCCMHISLDQSVSVTGTPLCITRNLTLSKIWNSRGPPFLLPPTV